jgi:predicted nucleic acid-binding protein
VIEAIEALRAICSECVSITEQTHHHAVDLARGHGFGLYDALIVAAALEAKCTILVTEDLQHGQVIANRLTVHNPFRQS